MVWNRKTAGGAATATAPSATGAPPPPSAPPVQAAAPVLPPVAAPAPPQPPAAAAPAAEPARRRRTAAAPAATEVAAAAPANAPAVVPPQALLPGFLALLAPKTQGPSALRALIDGRTAAGEPNIFPTVYMAGGETGGQMIAHDMNAEGTDADLPLGTDAVNVILLGVRFELILWPKGFVRGVKLSPASKAIVAFDDFDAVNALQAGVQKYSFRNRANQDQYDPVGHPQMVLEMLVYDEQAGLYCMQTAASYDSCYNTGKELDVAFPIVTPTPVVITPHTYTTPGSKKQPGWPEHYYRIGQDNNSPEMQKLKKAFNDFLNVSGTDPELMAAIGAWSKQTITPEQLGKLRAIASI